VNVVRVHQTYLWANNLQMHRILPCFDLTPVGPSSDSRDTLHRTDQQCIQRLLTHKYLIWLCVTTSIHFHSTSVVITNNLAVVFFPCTWWKLLNEQLQEVVVVWCCCSCCGGNLSWLIWREEPFSGHTTFSLNSFLIPTVVELRCCSFGSCCTRLTGGRCSNFIVAGPQSQPGGGGREGPAPG